MEILYSIKERTDLLLVFGIFNLVLGVFLIILSFTYPVIFEGTNAWYKPTKFALSLGILSVTVGWFSSYLSPSTGILVAKWLFLVTLAFEIIYITWQAARGQASHFNLSSPLYSFLYSLMAIAATLATLAVAYIGLQFFTQSNIDLPNHYLWAIRFGFILFVIFSLQGFIMGAKLSHFMGEPTNAFKIPFLGWSLSTGDLRVAHFVGMHALQVLPLISWFLLRNTTWTVVIAVLYTGLAIFVLVTALNGQPLVKVSEKKMETLD